MRALVLYTILLFTALSYSPANAQGYKGLIAPEDDQAATEKGYGGVTAAPAEDKTKPADTFTPIPGQQQRPLATADDLKFAAELDALKIDPDAPPPELSNVFTMPDNGRDVLAKPSLRIDGMLPVEYMAKKDIDAAMKKINDAALTPAERQQKIRETYDELLQLMSGLLTQEGISDSLYKTMKAPDIYVQETKEGTTKALTRLGIALQQLKKMM